MKPIGVCLLLAALLVPSALSAAAEVPTVAITEPEPGITLTSDSVPVQVEFAAPDGAAITRVAVLVDGVKIGATDFDPPQTSGVAHFTWRAFEYHNGPHEVVARAVDTRGRVAARSITVELQRRPMDLADALRIAAPRNGQTVSGVTEVRLEGDSGGEVKYVIFLVDRVFKGLTNVRPFTYRWDTTRYLNGLHQLQARAYLHDGSHYLTNIVEVRVDNPSGATSLRQPSAAAAQPASPAPADPVRAEAQVLPPPVRAENPGPSLSPMEVAQPEVVVPGSAPAVGPGGELVAPACPPATIAAEPTPAVAAIATQPAPAASSPGVAAVVPERPSWRPDEPVPVMAEQSHLWPAEVAEQSAGPGGLPQTAPIEIASLPTTAPASTPIPAAAEPATDTSAPSQESASTSPPSPPTPVAAPWERVPVTTSRPAGGRPTSASAAIQVAMLPPLPVAPEPAPRLAAEPPAGRGTYVVREGDCLWSIAQRLGVSPRALAEANNLANPSLVRAGMALRIPSITLVADGRPVVSDAPAALEGNRVIAPLRALIEHYGGTVTWEPATRTARAAALGHRLEVTVGSDRARVDDRDTSTGLRVELRHHRTMVPVTFMAKALGLRVTYKDGAVRLARAQ